MNDLSVLVGGAPAGDDGAPVERTAYGRITQAPLSNSDQMTVVLDDYSGERSFAVPAGHWAARGTELPTVGTRCLVVLDDRDDAWVPMWIGATEIPPVTFVSAAGAPDDAVGQDGALYLDTTALELYGPKAAGAWPSTPFAKLLPITPTWDDLHA